MCTTGLFEPNTFRTFTQWMFLKSELQCTFYTCYNALLVVRAMRPTCSWAFRKKSRDELTCNCCNNLGDHCPFHTY